MTIEHKIIYWLKDEELKVLYQALNVLEAARNVLSDYEYEVSSAIHMSQAHEALKKVLDGNGKE